MRKWFIIERWFDAPLNYWDRQVKYATDEEIVDIVSDPDYRGKRKRSSVLISELTEHGKIQPWPSLRNKAVPE